MGEHNIVSYSDDGRISVRNPIWVKKMLTVVVRMFDRVGLQMDLGKKTGGGLYPLFFLRAARRGGI